MENMGMVRRGRFNAPLAIKQINLFMPEDLKESFIFSVHRCKDSGKKPLFRPIDELYKRDTFAGKGLTEPCDVSYELLKCFERENPKFLFP